ncbi:MAG: 3-oxoacyl-ACP synthase III family protein [Vibrionaceae bacterium]
MILTHSVLALANNTIDPLRLLQDAGRSLEDAQKTIQRTGFCKLSFAAPLQLSEFVLNALSKLSQQTPTLFADVDAVIVVSQTFDQRIPSLSTRVQSLLKLSQETFCIDIIDGCAGFIKALSIAKMLEQQAHKKILVIAGDINSYMTQQSDVNTQMLFGDGVHIALLQASEEPLEVALFNQGDEKKAIFCSADDNIMQMNGFEVFRFTKDKIPALVQNFVKNQGKTLAEYDLLALHQASLLVVSTICDTLNYQNRAAANFACQNFGNLCSASIGAWLSQVPDLDKKGAQKMLAVGFGSGLSWGAASLEINLHINEVLYV